MAFMSHVPGFLKNWLVCNSPINFWSKAVSCWNREVRYTAWPPCGTGLHCVPCAVKHVRPSLATPTGWILARDASPTAVWYGSKNTSPNCLRHCLIKKWGHTCWQRHSLQQRLAPGRFWSCQWDRRCYGNIFIVCGRNCQQAGWSPPRFWRSFIQNLGLTLRYLEWYLNWTIKTNVEDNFYSTKYNTIFYILKLTWHANMY